MLTATDLSKSFFQEKLLHHLTLRIQPGENVLLLGSNGSGKSTLLRIIAGLESADSGSLRTTKNLGFLGHDLLLYPYLTVIENLTLFSQLGTPSESSEVSLDKILMDWELSTHRSKRVHTLSAGLKQRTSLARAFLRTPDLLLLDEPSAPLDHRSKQILFKNISALKETNQHTSLLIVTHDVQSFLPYCSRVVWLHEGRIHRDSDSADLNQSELLKEYEKSS